MSRRLSIRVLRNRWFWVNYAATLGLTCWIPLLSLTPVVVQSAPEAWEGGANTAELAVASTPPGIDTPGATVHRGPTTRIPLYTCYWRVFQGGFRHYLLPVALHLALCFAISFVVWRSVLRSATGPASSPPDQG
ncbi:MAG TPA: hypothetical protein PKI11_02605 [Candidatus Hydrogenedentes bacterium]|nr:hypothetical protein [Candidatus Hydrogenedentota bacterium]